MNEIWDKRREQLEEALRQAARDLLEYMNGAAGFQVRLDDRRWISVGQGVKPT